MWLSNFTLVLPDEIVSHGSVRVEDSILRANTGGGWNVQPGVSMHEDTEWVQLGSTLEQ